MQALPHSVPPTLQQATANPHLHWRLLDTHGQVWASLLCGHCSSLLGLVHTRLCLCPRSVCFPNPVWVLAALWWVNGDLFQEGLCHTQVCCTQSLCPHSSPLLARTSSGDTQTQFCLSLCGVSGSWCTQGLSQPSEHLWRVWGLILNAISPLLQSCWGLLCPWMWGISSQPLQHHATAAPAPHVLLGFFSKWPCLNLASIHFGGARQK